MRTNNRTVFIPENLEKETGLNDQQVAKLTGKAVQSLRNDRHLRRGIPYFRYGRSIRYRVQDVLDFMARNRVETT